MTKIYVTDVTLSDGKVTHTIKSIPIKHLPEHILLSDTSLMDNIKNKYVSDKLWNALTPKNHSIPIVKFHFNRECGYVNQDVIIPYL